MVIVIMGDDHPRFGATSLRASAVIPGGVLFTTSSLENMVCEPVLTIQADQKGADPLISSRVWRESVSLALFTTRGRYVSLCVLLRSSEPPPEHAEKALVFVGHPGVEVAIIFEVTGVQQSRISGSHQPSTPSKKRRESRTGGTKSCKGDNESPPLEVLKGFLGTTWHL
jgi:hypothetical protein